MTTVVSQVFSIEQRGWDLFAAAERLDLEGIVAKPEGRPLRARHGLAQGEEPGVHAG
jgi:hypothetical protein